VESKGNSRRSFDPFNLIMCPIIDSNGIWSKISQNEGLKVPL